MSENINNFRTTTISLDEYNNLVSEINTLKEKIGAQDQIIYHLKEKINELKTKQPEVKLTTGVKHFNDDNYDCYFEEYNVNKVEFINLTEVERMAEEKAKSEVKDKLEKLENKNQELKEDLRRQDNSYQTIINRLNDTITELKRDINKKHTDYQYSLQDKKDEYERNLSDLDRAYKKDTNAYKETIKELKEEIQNIKENKTDLEIEKKRNEEIKTLKGRISDLEKILNDIKDASFFGKIKKLHKIELEQNTAAQELKRKEYNANKVGITWVKEGSKIRNFNSFTNLYHILTNKSVNWICGLDWWVK